MRFLMLMYPGPKPENGHTPTRQAIEAMMKYNDELTKAGVLLALDGLQPTSKGARIRFAQGKPLVTNGPFAEAREVVGGYWLIQVNSKAEAVEWASRCPASDDEMIELRQIYEISDFAPETITPEAAALYEHHQRQL